MTRIFGLILGALLAVSCSAISINAHAADQSGTYETQGEAYAACNGFVAWLNSHGPLSPPYYYTCEDVVRGSSPPSPPCLGKPFEGVNYSYAYTVYSEPNHDDGGWAGWYFWCAPTFSPSKNNGCSCSVAGDPINLGTGNEYEDQKDYSSSDSLRFERYYNSSNSITPTNIGAQWLDNYDRSIQYQTSTTPVATVFRPDGKEFAFQKVNGVWAADPDVSDTLTESDNALGQVQSWTYFDAQTQQYENYNAGGALTSIVDLSGQVTTLTYSDGTTPTTIAPMAGLLITVTAPSGRQLQFVYNASSQITQITLPDGGTLAYAYDTSGNLTQVTYPDGRTRVYKYDESGNAPSGSPNLLTGIIDEAGQRYVDIHYDSQGRAMSSQIGGIANLTQVAYNSDGTSAVTYPSGVQTTIGFATPYGRAQIASVSQPCGPGCDQTAAARTYDANGNPASATDFNGNVTTTTYDVNGLLDQQIDASGSPAQRTTNFTWNTTLRVPLTRTVLDANGNTVSNTQWVYNATGQTLARCDIDPANSADSGYSCSNTGAVPAGVRRRTYTYCTAVGSNCPLVGLMLTATGPRTDLTQTTSYSYYTSSSTTGCGTPGAACYQPGDLYQVTDALGHVTTIASYDADGRITRLTDANGVNTDLTYTPRGWLASRTVGGATTRFTYTAYGAVQTVTDPDGVTTTYGYDAAHRLTTITDALGNTIQYTLDAAGDKTAEQVYDSSGTLHQSLTRTFNTLGQLTSVVDGLSHTVFNASATGSYDANGNLIQSSDGLGIARQLGYDALNRLVQTLDNYNGSDPATKNTTTQYSYDSLDRLTQVTDPSNLATTYSYDGLSDATGQVSPDTGTTSRTFDAAGNVLTRTDAKGITASNTYDALDRLVSTRYPDSTQNVTYSYDDPNGTTGCSTSDPVGRLTRIIESAVTTVYCYDARGNVIQKQQITSAGTDTTGYALTNAGRLSGIVYPDSTLVSYSRDGDGRITGISVTPPSGSAGTAVSAVTYQPFGPVSGYTLGNGQQIARTYDANYRLTDLTSPAFTLHVARDAMGDITAIGNSPGASPATETYSYDPLYRLTAVTEANGTTLESVTYNQTGDRLTKTGSGLATGTYSYTPNTHQLIATGNATRTVDADGNTTAISEAGSTYGFGYNDRNRMSTAQLGGSTVANYTYNALNQRIQKVAGSNAERYDYNEGSGILAEYGATNRDYIWMDGIPVANVDTANGTSTIAYVTADQLGTPRAIADSSGNTEWQNAYQGNPWNEVAPTSSGYVYNLGFPGQYFDAETGLSYNVNRDYDSSTGRYVQSDPFGLNGGLSTYAYAISDPLSTFDSLGLRPLTAGEVAMLTPIFNNTVNFSQVDIESGTDGDFRAAIPLANGDAVTINNTIHFPSSQYLPDFSQGDLSDQAWLAHEVTHIFQHQNEPGYTYGKAMRETWKYGKHVYDYSLTEHKCFTDYRYEQQAAIVHDYFVALHQGTPDLSGFENLLGPMGLGMNHN
ncbi:MAG TPA: RHS repeat-associated core domain-containing protein [Dyella sp.]|uniref:RHS repeat-associated core domain-containing protein n=1 Tax=Dyella sp. TaxID=1869338 RepID=UPI002B9B36E9|nr:RHS repeat-associated core domain-containing protein [Dyella sp.]HTV83817.1 RHS repeat-associated core domain-containing protein [Dyella sp.]